MQPMKKTTISLVILLCNCLLGFAQTYTRETDESAESFVDRIKPKEKTLAHPVIETTWNSPDGRKVIFAFWDMDITGDDGKYIETCIVGKLLVPADESSDYKMIEIDKFHQNPSTPEILSVFFYDCDNDGVRELGILYSSDYQHYMMAGTFYQGALYAALDYDSLPEQLFCLQDIYGGALGNNDSGDTYPEFSNTSELRAYLKKQGTPRKWQLNFIKNFEGTIGTTKIYAHLEKRGSELEGFYFEEESGIETSIRGSINQQDGTISIGAWNKKEGHTIKIEGLLKDGGFAGEWTDRRTDEKAPVKLKEIETNFTSSSEIVGIYTISNEEYSESGNCPVRAKIERKDGKYLYTLTIDRTQYRGDVSFTREIGRYGEIAYITFEGFKWAENLGDISDEDAEHIATDTYGLEGVWEKKGISIQNYGNSMNYYVKIRECDCKFIFLKKEK
ncbi:hypothetical protein [Dysgonomonas sp. 25]|uniref:hypothetical protein n=1 Tax=Dysgonomonas sp. 25 TaxID=2302933 RepID=UPI0013D38CBD|nr:hypothetical protein [Dysgonomonas sp. 25]NDV69008.1 hypothetical protein [Dysgonomonas sp. 25]